MIKLAHTHKDGKQCFTSKGHYKEVGVFLINEEECIIGYKPYTAHWYCYDPTGKEIATFTTEFYTLCLRQYRIADMVRDPNCF
jgi:hypothetical protein